MGKTETDRGPDNGHLASPNAHAGGQRLIPEAKLPARLLLVKLLLLATAVPGAPSKNDRDQP